MAKLKRRAPRPPKRHKICVTQCVHRSTLNCKNNWTSEMRSLAQSPTIVLVWFRKWQNILANLCTNTLYSECRCFYFDSVQFKMSGRITWVACLFRLILFIVFNVKFMKINVGITVKIAAKYKSDLKWF